VKRILLGTGGALVALIVVVVLAFRLSPWPTVAIIQYVFARSDVASEERLARHVPQGIVSRLDIAYGAGPTERLDVFYREGANPQATIVWIHGGAWIAGSKEGVSNYLRVLAGEGFTTVAVGYSTGWGTAYPEPVRQANAALAYLLANAANLSIDPHRIVIAGSSAGAQISAQLAMLTNDPVYAEGVGIAPAVPAGTIKGAILMSGAFDLEEIDLDGDYGWFMRAVLWAYSGVRDFMTDDRFRLASVTPNVTASFPPSFISSGNGDPLEPQAVRLAERLIALGVPTTTLFFPADLTPKLPHEFQLNLDTPEGIEALNRMVDFVRKTAP
jgi:acetyl esterase